MGKKSCIFGGAFDPVHMGHLQIARYCLQTLFLDRVFWVPTYSSPVGKPYFAGYTDRIKLLELVLDPVPEFTLSTIEEILNKPSYTLDTILELKKKFPEYSDWYLLIGSDNLVQFDSWHQPGRILEEVTLAVYPRDGFVPGPDAIPHQLLDAPHYRVSSSELRQKLNENLPLDESAIPRQVSEFITRHKLYI